ncbi:MAG: LptF/LptG family permease [Blastocatellia bacterium]|nr:LptF/LptG family permease [Blastocatellia bacterium]
MRTSITISRYLIQAILPYFIFSWVLLSVILFVQQGGRFADIFFSVNIPSALIWQLTIALVPNVIAFTCPMAVLVGVIIGLSKMQGDSELVAIRAAGIGNLQILAPVVILGVILSLFAFSINVFGVPLAAGIVRQVAIQAAIYKLESPIEPGVFNTELAGFTVYVKDGDLAEGQWKNIFIHNEDAETGVVRLITSTHGRIDSTEQQSELVLENAVVWTFQRAGISEKFVSEKIGQVRFAIQTRRGELIEKLSTSDISAEEMGLAQLAEYAAEAEGKDRIEAQIVWQRRILLSITPLIFCVLGTILILRFSRGGRGFGIFLALISLIIFFLLAFLGEQLARTGWISVFMGSMIPFGASAAAIIWFSLSTKLRHKSPSRNPFTALVDKIRDRKKKGDSRNYFVDLTTGLRDFDLLLNILRHYALTVGFLAAVFVIFTAFELWRFAGTMDGGIWLLTRYLVYLLPFVYIQLAPSAAMVAVLATYVIKSRQNEIVTWTSAGQSVYRLLFPCFILMLFLGVINWQIQERVAPYGNLMQDLLRTQIRDRGSVRRIADTFWVANDRRIYSFRLAPDLQIDEADSALAAKKKVNSTPFGLPLGTSNSASDNEKEQSGAYQPSGTELEGQRPPSDNEIAKVIEACVTSCPVYDLVVYEFVDKGAELQAVYRSEKAEWQGDKIRFVGEAVASGLGQQNRGQLSITGGELIEPQNPFSGFRKKPSHMTIDEAKRQLALSGSELERRTFAVAVEKRYSTLFLPFIIALFTAPFALSLSRKGKVVTVGYAIGLWLLFMGFTGVFEQFGASGALDPRAAVWGPLMLFSMLGVFLLSRDKT